MSLTRSRSFYDPRFIGGVFLIVLSVIAVVVVLRHAHAGQAMYAARSDLAAGDVVHASDFTVVSARLDDSGAYVASGHLPKEAVLSRSVAKGELLPKRSVGEGADLNPLVITLAQPIPSSVTRGATVTLWAAPGREGQATGDEKPNQLTHGAVYVGQAGSKNVTTSGTVIEVRIPGEDIDNVLSAAGRQVPILAVAGAR